MLEEVCKRNSNKVSHGGLQSHEHSNELEGEAIKDNGADMVDTGRYRSLIGCLMYLTATRLDILYVVSVMLRFMHFASELNIKVAKRVVRYVKGTLNYGEV